MYPWRQSFTYKAVVFNQSAKTATKYQFNSQIISLDAFHHTQRLLSIPSENVAMMFLSNKAETFLCNEAETFLYNIADNLLGKLGSNAVRTLCSEGGGEIEREKLESTLSTIRAMLLDAKEQQEKNHQLTNWLRKLKDAFYDADDALDELEYDASQRVGKTIKVCVFLSGLFSVRIGDKIREIREKLDEIAAEKAKFRLTERFVDRRVVHMGRETHSFVDATDVIGRDVDKEKIVRLLMCPGNGENVSIIPIVGIGGLGKTALAKLVYNDERVSRHFELKRWVCVSEDFDVKKLTKNLIKSASDTNFGDLRHTLRDDLTIDELQNELRSTLDNKKFLLILDDIWNEDRVKWMELRDLLLGGANGSKIVVTTRSQSVASIMGTIREYNLTGLSHEDCMSLFVKLTFKEGEEKRYPNLLKIGEEIVKKCGGVPLAVRTLGSPLYSKTDERDWLFVKDNEIWKLEQKENDILPALRLSYNQMTFNLKQCFALCSIFPKDYQIYDVDLIQLWIAQGLIQSSNENQELEDMGKRYIRELRMRSFLEDADDFGPFQIFKMHDLVHDLALLVAQTECYTINSYTRFIPKGVRHVSFSGNDLSLDEVPSFLVDLNAQTNVRSIFFPVSGVVPISKSFAEKCISKFKYLRVLVLRESQSEVLPSSIDELKHLRFLDLYSSSIKKLPNSICKLQNLQTLRLQGCSELEELPKDIGNLINLRFLLLTTKNMFLPEEGIGHLNSLRYLGIANCRNLKSLGEGIQRLTALRTLAIWDCANLESLPHFMKYLTALETLFIFDCKNLNLTEWEEDVQGVKLSLRSFCIGGLQQLVALPQWLQEAANTLQLLRISNCFNLTALPEWLQNLTALEKLDIRRCPKLSVLPEGMHCLTTLKELKILWCSPELSRRCRKETGEDWPKIAHVPKITCESQSQPDGPLITWLVFPKQILQEISLLVEENMVLQDMVVSGRSTRDEAGPSKTSSVLQPLAVAVVPSPSTATLSQTQSQSQPDGTVNTWLVFPKHILQKISLLVKEKMVFQDMVVSGRSTREEAGPSETASVLQPPDVAVVPSPSTAILSQTQSQPQPGDTLIICEFDEHNLQTIARLVEENMVLQDMVVSRRSTRDEAGPSGTASVL